MKADISAIITLTEDNRAEVDRIVAALLKNGIAKGVLKRRDPDGEKIFILSEVEPELAAAGRQIPRANAA